MVRFENLSYSYPNQYFGLKELTLSIEKGEFVFIHASTAEYKTTFLNLIYGETFASSGKLWILDYVLPDDKKKVSQIRQHIGYAFHPFNFFDNLTVKDNLLVTLYIRNNKKMKEELKHYVDEFIKKYSQLNPVVLAKNLSSGEKQHLNLMRALIFNPLILLADDPFKFFQKKDIEHWMKILNEKNSQGLTIIATTSNISIAESYNKKAYFLKNGRIYDKNDQK